MISNRIRIYEANRETAQGIARSFVEMARDLRVGRELGIRLFKRDFAARHRQSMLGFLWVLILPLVTTAVFVGLNTSGIINVGKTEVPYVVYALFGLTVWNLFSGISTNISKILIETAALVTKINFTRISLIFSPVLSALVDFGIRMLLLGCAIIIYGSPPNGLGILLFFIAVVPLALLSVGIGLFAAVAGALVKDIPNMLTLGFTFLMLLSPVVYPLSGRSGIIGIIGQYNPLTPIFDTTRDLFFRGSLASPYGYLFASLLCILVFLMGWRFYYVALGRITEKV